jgi:hypothetical protein
MSGGGFGGRWWKDKGGWEILRAREPERVFLASWEEKHSVLGSLEKEQESNSLT